MVAFGVETRCTVINETGCLDQGSPFCIKALARAMELPPIAIEESLIIFLQQKFIRLKR